MKKYLLFWVLGGLLIVGCEEGVTPVLGTPEPYTAYGTFNPMSDTQAVRLYAIDEVLDTENTQPLAARVVSTNLTDGSQQVWRDSIVTFDDGQRGNVFWSAFRPTFGQRYRLTMERLADGATATVEMAVPPEVAIEVLPPVSTEIRGRLPIRINGAAPRLLRVRVRYDTGIVVLDNTTFEEGFLPTAEVTLSYQEQVQQVNGDWMIEVDILSDLLDLKQALLRVGDITSFPDPIGVRDIVLLLDIVEDAWNPAVGTFDPEVLVQPNTFSNVENGFGFVGAGYSLTRSILPDSLVLCRANYDVPGGCP